jgi:hypothetical protein
MASRIFKSSHFPNFILASGVISYGGMLWNAEEMRKRLQNPIIKEAINTILENQEAVDQLGPEFRIRTNLMSMVNSKVELETPYGEARFKIKSTKGNFDVVVNTSSHQLESIESTTNPHLNKVKFYIPEKQVTDTIQQTENKDDLKKVALDPKTRFTSIDFISLTKKESNSIILKPVASSQNDKELPRKTLYDIYTEGQVALSGPQSRHQEANSAFTR